MLALGRQIVAGEEDAGSVESVLEQAWQVAAEGKALLVIAQGASPDVLSVETPSRVGLTGPPNPML